MITTMLGIIAKKNSITSYALPMSSTGLSIIKCSVPLILRCFDVNIKIRNENIMKPASYTILAVLILLNATGCSSSKKHEDEDDSLKKNEYGEIVLHEKKYKLDNFPAFDGTLTREHLVKTVGKPNRYNHSNKAYAYDIYYLDSGNELTLTFKIDGRLRSAVMWIVVNNEMVDKKVIYPRITHK